MAGVDIRKASPDELISAGHAMKALPVTEAVATVHFSGLARRRHVFDVHRGLIALLELYGDARHAVNLEELQSQAQSPEPETESRSDPTDIDFDLEWSYCELRHMTQLVLSGIHRLIEVYSMFHNPSVEVSEADKREFATMLADLPHISDPKRLCCCLETFCSCERSLKSQLLLRTVESSLVSYLENWYWNHQQASDEELPQGLWSEVLENSTNCCGPSELRPVEDAEWEEMLSHGGPYPQQRREFQDRFIDVDDEDRDTGLASEMADELWRLNTFAVEQHTFKGDPCSIRSILRDFAREGRSIRRLGYFYFCRPSYLDDMTLHFDEATVRKNVEFAAIAYRALGERPTALGDVGHGGLDEELAVATLRTFQSYRYLLETSELEFLGPVLATVSRALVIDCEWSIAELLQLV